MFSECSRSNFNYNLCDPNAWGWIFFGLVMALVFKMFFAISVYGTCVPAGVFIPSMMWGGVFGRLLGMIFQAIHENHRDWGFFSECPPEGTCITPGMYSLIGAIASLGGITKLTVSLTVIMFELTGNLNYIIPCMVSLMVAKVVGDFFVKGGITEVMIQTNKYPFLDPRDDDILGMTIGYNMTGIDNLVLLTQAGMCVADIDRVLDQYTFSGFPVVTTLQDPSLVGYITRSDLSYALEKARLYKNGYLDPKVAVFFNDTEFKSPTYGDASLTASTSVPLVNHMKRRQSHHRLFPSDQSLNLSSYVDKTPLGVDPRVPIEFVLDLFKKMGPRLIIIKQQGRLKGLVTKKDMLQTLHYHNAPPIIPVARTSTQPPLENPFRPLTREEEIELLS